jgi:aminopeptidase N
MWFGDLVTMRWFNDVWMKETLANFMAATIVNPSFPQINHDLRFLLSYHPQAYDVDRTAGANPTRQELPNLNEAGTLYGAVIYEKGPSSCVSSKPSSVRIPSARACASIYGATHSPMPPGSIW